MSDTNDTLPPMPKAPSAPPPPPGRGGSELRQWYAGLAMQSLIHVGAKRIAEEKLDARRSLDLPSAAAYFGDDYGEPAEAANGLTAEESLAYDAFAIADAMVAEIERRESAVRAQGRPTTAPTSPATPPGMSGL